MTDDLVIKRQSVDHRYLTIRPLAAMKSARTTITRSRYRFVIVGVLRDDPAKGEGRKVICAFEPRDELATAFSTDAVVRSGASVLAFASCASGSTSQGICTVVTVLRSADQPFRRSLNDCSWRQPTVSGRGLNGSTQSEADTKRARPA